MILDAGGGPGRYTIELAKLGYNVVLLDLVPELLQHAKKRIKMAGVQNKINKIIKGSITDLSSFLDKTFDAVLCLGGPLSHVKGAGNRKKAISELIRVAKKDSPIFVSVIGRINVLLKSPRYWPQEIRLTTSFKRAAEQGDVDRFHGKCYCHFYLPEELKNDFIHKDLKVLEMVGLEGLSSSGREEINKIAKNKKIWKNWLVTHYKFCTHPVVVGISEHILLIGRKKK